MILTNVLRFKVFEKQFLMRLAICRTDGVDQNARKKGKKERNVMRDIETNVCDFNWTNMATKISLRKSKCINCTDEELGLCFP